MFCTNTNSAAVKLNNSLIRNWIYSLIGNWISKHPPPTRSLPRPSARAQAQAQAKARRREINAPPKVWPPTTTANPTSPRANRSFGKIAPATRPVSTRTKHRATTATNPTLRWTEANGESAEKDPANARDLTRAGAELCLSA